MATIKTINSSGIKKRKNKNLTQQELADLVEVSRKKYIGGKINVQPQGILKNICHNLRNCQRFADLIITTKSASNHDVISIAVFIVK